MRNLKALVLVCAIALASSAASAASASADPFRGESYPLRITGALEPSTQLVIGTTAGSISCTSAAQQGEAGGQSTSLTMTTTLAGCTALGFSATVHMNGCDFIYRIDGGSQTSGTFDIDCPTGQEITITAVSAGITKCTFHIGDEVGLGGNTYATLGTGATREITAAINVVNLSYTHTAGTGLGKCTTGEAHNGTLQASSIWTGELYDDVAHVGFFAS